MSQKPACQCPPQESLARGVGETGELCPRCQGVKPKALVPPPPRASANRDALTEFPPLKLEPSLPRETLPKLDRSKAERAEAAANPRGEQRQKSHALEQRKVTRLLAVAIVIWALFSLLPGGVAWRNWLGDWTATTLPLWLPLFAAFGVSPLCLGISLLQLPDWCTLKSVAAGLLVTACGYAFSATLFGLAGPNSLWLAWLDFPLSDAAAATLWCACMLVLAATLSLICFLEGQRWQRVEQLFAELQKKSDAGRPGSGS